MNSAVLADMELEREIVDPIEEMRLRIWARKNYAPAEERSDDWHPIILDEMLRRDLEI